MAPSLLTRAIALAALLGAAAWGHAAVKANPPAKGPAKTVGYRAKDCNFTRERTVECTGNVKIWREDLSLACQKLIAKFAPDESLVSAVCTGAVQVVTRDAVAEAETARFDGARNEVELSGKPRALQKNSRLDGSVIRLNVMTGTIEVEDARGVFKPDAPAEPERPKGVP